MQRLYDAEASCVAQINRCLTKRGAKHISSISDLFPAEEVALTTFPELDPFGPRENATYLGAGYAMPAVPPISWEAKHKRHIFAYLRPSVPGCEQVLLALQRLDADVICVIPEHPMDWIQRFPKIRFFAHPVDLPALLSEADLAITYGATTIPVALLSGVPVLVVPQVIEQYLSGLALEAIGAGLMLREQRAERDCLMHLDQLLADTRYRESAKAFASRYIALDIVRATQNAIAFLFASSAFGEV